MATTAAAAKENKAFVFKISNSKDLSDAQCQEILEQFQTIIQIIDRNTNVIDLLDHFIFTL